MEDVQPIDEDAVIRLPAEPTDADIRAGVRSWLELLAAGDYQTAVKAFYFRWRRSPESLRTDIEDFCGPAHCSPVAEPTAEVLARSEVYRTGIPSDCLAVVGFFVPRVDRFGIWTTALVRRHGSSVIFEFEIFHL
jgi:hypothetical protein